jgi:hypothetical protein
MLKWIVPLLLVAAGAIAATAPDPAALRSPSAFASITPAARRSQALFGEMGRVLQSPRCLNCHPRTDSPTQGDAMVVHSPPVTRGPTDHGAPGMECATCHGPRNAAFAGGPGTVPGNPKWHLAPLALAWQGKSLREICELIRDPARNGGMTLAQLVKHNGTDTLVGWGWHPGEGRTPAPGTQAAFGKLTQAWVDSGAKCPD